MKKNDTPINLQVDTPAKRFKGILLLLIDPFIVKGYSGVNEDFYNPKIEKILITVKGEPKELHLDTMVLNDHFEQYVTLFGKAIHDQCFFRALPIVSSPR